MITTSFDGVISDLLYTPCVEPEPRNKDGMRFIWHRFPIKGGIRPVDIWAKLITAREPLWEALREKGYITESNGDGNQIQVAVRKNR